ncbi:MAG: hypothetical protein WBA93_17280 [Microcoleaceae cyanobacterium]
MGNAIYFGSENTTQDSVGNVNSVGQTAAVPGSCISPDNNGYSYVMLDESSKATATWEANKLESSAEEIQQLKAYAKHMVKQAMFAKQKKRYLGIISKAEAVVVDNFAKTKVIVAENVRKQWDSVNKMFTGMDKVWAGYSIGQHRRQNDFQMIDERRLATIGKMQQQQSKQLSALSNKN